MDGHRIPGVAVVIGYDFKPYKFAYDLDCVNSCSWATSPDCPSNVPGPYAAFPEGSTVYEDEESGEHVCKACLDLEQSKENLERRTAP